MNLTNDLANFASAFAATNLPTKTASSESSSTASESVLNPRPESRKTAMAAPKPFWTLRVHEKRDVLVARQKARQIAHLLHFAPLDEACVAAGVFAIAAQAREQFEIADICFHLENNQLVVCAKPLGAALGAALVAAGAVEAKAPLMKLAKALPDAAREFAVDELAFLIGRINDQAPVDLYGELSKQNQEILLLLHLLTHSGDQLNQKSPLVA